MKTDLIRRPSDNLHQVGITIDFRREHNAKQSQHIPHI